MNDHSHSRITAGLVALLIIWYAGAPPAAPISEAKLYRVVDLGTLGGEESGAIGMNGEGNIVGWSRTANGERHAFLYDGRTMNDLGTLPGGSTSFAISINDRDQVVGYSGINAAGPQFQEVSQGFIWEGGQMRPLGALHCPCDFNRRYGSSAGLDINNSSIVASGWSETAQGEWVQHAFTWRAGGLEDIGGGAGDWSLSRAFAVNDSGQVVGDFARNGGRLSRFDRVAVKWTEEGMLELGALPGDTSSSAQAINEAGAAAGWSGNADGSKSTAVVWNAGEMTELGALPGDAASRASSINAAGEVVGWSGRADRSQSRAFLWQDGTLIDLNGVVPASQGWKFTEAAVINDAGKIAGTGTHNGKVRAFLLEPVVGVREHSVGQLLELLYSTSPPR